MFALAEILGKSAAEIEELTISEWHHWLAYFKLKEQRMKVINKKR